MTAATTALSIQRTQLIVDLHRSVEAALRRSVSDAIRIGGLLIDQKETLPHGEFLAWVERELPFNERTAQRYMLVFRHKSKCDTLSDLNTAYQVAQIEDRRQAIVKEAKRAERVEQFEDEPEPEAKAKRELPELDDKERLEKERVAYNRVAEESGTDGVAEVLIRDIDIALDALQRDSFRHSVINALVKHLRDRSIQLNRKVGVA